MVIVDNFIYRHRWIFVLLFFIPSTNGEIWMCSGIPTTYTFTDCETDKSLTDGCYYLVHFEQYRPCNDICDGVEMWSIDEERCRSYCPGYLNKNCKIGSKRLKQQNQPSTTTTTTSALSSTIGYEQISLSSKTLQPPIDVIIVLSSFSALLVACVSITICMICCKRTLVKEAYLPAQTTDSESYLESLKLGSALDTPQNKTATDDNNNNNKMAELFLVEENRPMVMMID